MPAPPDLSALRATTRDAAAALFEDMQHIREILARPFPGPSRAEMRRLSAILRRLVVEHDIQRVANPRIGRIKLAALDMNPLIAAGLVSHLTVGTLGQSMSVFASGSVTSDNLVKKSADELIAINMEGFCQQKTICFRGVWINRQTVIKFVANSLSGIHSHPALETVEDKLLTLVRGTLVRTVNEDNSTNIYLQNGLFSDTNSPINYDPKALDPTLLDLLATAELISKSDDVIRLEEEIKKEVGH